MDDPSLLQVIVGASRLPTEEHRATLIIEAENERLEALQLQLGRAQQPMPIMISLAVLAESPEAELTWFCYNDKRMNGVLPPERWKTVFPNIQLDSKKTYHTRTLAQILSEWPAACDNQRRIDLALSQGDPLKALAGAGEWLQRIQRIRLQSPRAKKMWLESCDAWLQLHGFRLDPAVPLSWNLDPLATELIRKQADINTLHQQLKDKQKLHEKCKQKLWATLRHVFPYSAYRDKRPDLASLKDQELVSHFLEQGMDKGVDLSFYLVQSELQKLRGEQVEQTAKLELLDNKTRQTTQHLELLKKLLTQLMINS